MLARADHRLSSYESRSPAEDWGRALQEAGRKRRVLSEALDRRSDQRRTAMLAAAWAGFGTLASSLATYLDLGPWTYLVPASIGMAFVSCSAAAFLLILDRQEARDTLTADTARCTLIVKQIQAVQHDPALAGDALLDRLLGEFRAVAQRHQALDGMELVPERRHRRFAVRNRTVTCTLDSGEKQTAMIRDLSRSGVALRTELRLQRGTILTIGSTPARVVRMTEDGMAFEFLRPFPRERFSQDTVL